MNHLQTVMRTTWHDQLSLAFNSQFPMTYYGSNTLMLGAYPLEDSRALTDCRCVMGLDKDALIYSSVLLHEVHFFTKQKQTTIRKMNFLMIFFSVAESHSSFDMISNRSKILLYGVLKIPLQKHTEQTQDKQNRIGLPDGYSKHILCLFSNKKSLKDQIGNSTIIKLWFGKKKPKRKDKISNLVHLLCCVYVSAEVCVFVNMLSQLENL